MQDGQKDKNNVKKILLPFYNKYLVFNFMIL